MIVRRSMRGGHRWVGLIVGLLAAYMAATGAMMALRHDPALAGGRAPTRHCATPDALAHAVAVASARHPGVAFDTLWLRADPVEPLSIRFVDAVQVDVDPCSGRLRDVRSRYAGWDGIAEYLHRLIFLGIEPGKAVAGSVATALSLLAVTGLWLWWPRRRGAWGSALRPARLPKGRTRRRARHGLVGTAVLPLALPIALAGMTLAFPAVADLLYRATGSVAATRPVVPARSGPVAYAEAWRGVLSRLGDVPAQAMIRAPKAPTAAIEINLHDPDARNPEGRQYFFADPGDGRILLHRRYADTPAGARLYYWGYAVHQGKVGGIAGLVATLLTMAGIVYLAISGLRSWLARHPVPSPRFVRMRIVEVVDECDGVKAFRLVPVDPGPIAAATPGAHVAVRLSDTLLRHYSLTNAPGERDDYRIAVRADPSGRGGSLAMHGLVAGAELLVAPPANHFPVVRGTRHAVLVAAGIGITPILAMARHFRAKGIAFELHYFGRTRESMPFRSVIAAELGDAATLHIALSRTEQAARMAAIVAAPARGRHLYSCGQVAFMDALFDAARAAGWRDGALHREAFGVSAQDAAPPRAFVAKLAHSGRRVPVPADRSLLDALADAGVRIDRSCGMGVCGACLVGVVDGAIEHRDAILSPADRRSGRWMTACVSRAGGTDLTLDL
ncbi:PepSY domain-containing protein [Sphingomonas sp. Leaf11]|nr:PepSY domain-containing protein [Sphingomonas sp. Leaf11]KQM27054.1 hypothetical protein ASE58_08675 [Sphingomonas sp. Leaf9]KQM43388.1 hypothetical protein ASE57_08670 [Sphingomonas sp. Leaf11]